jgi:hypothetical protein
MSEIIEETQDLILQAIGLELMFCTPEKCSLNDGITSVELARKLNFKIDVVRKKLKILASKGIIRSTGINPKCWKFDEYNFYRMDENDPVYKMLCDFEDVDFDKYFDY